MTLGFSPPHNNKTIENWQKIGILYIGGLKPRLPSLRNMSK
jgi:hypothetical protein